VIEIDGWDPFDHVSIDHELFTALVQRENSKAGIHSPILYLRLS